MQALLVRLDCHTNKHTITQPQNEYFYYFRCVAYFVVMVLEEA